LHFFLKTNVLRLRKWKVILGVICIGLGIWFRFGNLHQVYWHDEAFTSLRISGYTSLEVKQSLFNNQLVSLDELLYYQGINQERTALDTVKSLAFDDAQHPPFYYVLAWFWVKIWGNSVANLRGFSVFVSLFSLPAIYWLCQELFALTFRPPNQERAPHDDQDQQDYLKTKNLTSSIAMIIVATSPVHVLYAQEAREYALWTGLVLTMSAALVRSLRLHHWKNWSLYTILLTVSLYTSPLSGFVALGHGVYVLLREHCRLSRRVLAYGLAATLGLICFVPWLVVTLNDGAVGGASWTAQPIPLVTWLKLWGLHIVRCFILTEGDFSFDTGIVYGVLPLALGAIAYAFYYLCRYSPRDFWLFVLIFTSASALPLVIPDLVLGGQRSTAGRYLLPTFLGIQLALAYAIAHTFQIFQKSKLKGLAAKSPRKLKQGILSIVLLSTLILNIWSGVQILSIKTSWIKVINYHLPSLSAVVNTSQKPLIVSAATGINFGTIFALSHILNPKVVFLLLKDTSPPNADDITTKFLGFRDIFLFNPSPELRESLLQQNIQATLVYQDFHLFLWKLSALIR
jgi:uncharacterized membrane protein